MRPICLIYLAVLSVAFSRTALAAGKSKHVVVIVWDGMRPDFISESNCPALFQLAHEGVRFENHHSVFLSETEPNGTSIATGAYPEHHGIFGDKDFRPEISPWKPIHPEVLEAARKGDEETHGHHLLVPTVAELLHQHGLVTVIAGSKPIALLQDRAERSLGAPNISLFAGQTIPANVSEIIRGLHGAFPLEKVGADTRNDWTTDVLIDPLWAKDVPPYSLLWLNEPDASQHQFGPGSEQALNAIKNNDNNLARVLRTLDAKGIRNQTDIMVVSDHGFSTILSSLDVAETLRNAGFHASREFIKAPATGDILVVGNGGSTFLFVIGHDKKVINDAVKFLQGWSYSGVIFARTPIDGAFTLAQARMDSPRAPDIILSFRWNASLSDTGTAGMLVTDLSSYKPGQGMHGSLSPFEMHNTFVAAGPDFRSGVVDYLPTGNTDIAPTTLWILGVQQPKTMDGRVVVEALKGAPTEIKSFEPLHLEATRDLGNSVWHQYLNFTEVNGVAYFDEGNGFQTSK